MLLIRGGPAENQAVDWRAGAERHAQVACKGLEFVQHRVMQVRMKKSPSAKTGLNLFS
jgi:hypothetical protein